MSAARHHLSAADPVWRFSHYTGLFFDEQRPVSAWIRAAAALRLPATKDVQTLILRGEFHPDPDARGLEASAPGLNCRVNGRRVGELRNPAPGPFELRLTLPPESAERMTRLTLHLT